MVSMKEWKKRAQAAGATTKEIMQALESNSLPALVLEYETVIAPQKAAEEARNFVEEEMARQKAEAEARAAAAKAAADGREKMRKAAKAEAKRADDEINVRVAALMERHYGDETTETKKAAAEAQRRERIKDQEYTPTGIYGVAYSQRAAAKLAADHQKLLDMYKQADGSTAGQMAAATARARRANQGDREAIREEAALAAAARAAAAKAAAKEEAAEEAAQEAAEAAAEAEAEARAAGVPRRRTPRACTGGRRRSSA